MPSFEGNAAPAVAESAPVVLDNGAEPGSDEVRSHAFQPGLPGTLAAAGVPLAATAVYFIFGEPLWAILALGGLNVIGFALPGLRPVFAFARTVLAFLALTFAINTFGIAYPYSNIFVLTGLLGMFSLSGREWKSLYFGAGATRRFGKPALVLAAATAILILTVYFQRPELLGNNPTPRAWPADVIVLMAIGYALFSALMEETIFRSLFMAYARQSLGVGIAIAAQALIFAMMHYRVGFPMQAAGGVLALIWALAAGWLVKKADSVYPAYLMHFIVVLSLFLVLAFA